MLADGIRFCRMTDERLKNNTILINIYTYFDEDNRADHSAVAYMLTDSCKKYPDYITMSKKCADLYGCSLSNFMEFQGNCRMLNLSISTIDSRFALDGEKLEQEAAELLLECLLEPRVENNAFSLDLTETAKRTLYDDALGQVNDRRDYARIQGARIAYRGENIAIPIDGEPEDILKVTPESACAAYKKMLKHGFIDIRAVGCSSFDDALEVFRNAFTKLERGEYCQPLLVASALKSEPEYAYEELPMQQAIIRMYFKDPDLNDRAANKILASILGGTTTSRFFSKIREQQSLCYYCSCASNRHIRTMIVNAAVNPENVEKLKAAVLAEIQDICDNGVTEEELELAKLDSIEQMRSMADNPRSVLMWYANNILNEQFYSPEELIEEYSKVTAERVQAVCREYRLDSCFTLMPKEAANDQ